MDKKDFKGLIKVIKDQGENLTEEQMEALEGGDGCWCLIGNKNTESSTISTIDSEGKIDELR